MPTITTSDLEIIIPKGGVKKNIAAEEFNSFTEIGLIKNVAGLDTTITGDAFFVGKGVSESSFALDSTKKNTPELLLQNSNFTKNDIKISGKDGGYLKTTSAFIKNNLNGSKGNDTIRFGKNSTLKEGTIKLNKGADSISFGNQATVKAGKIILGKGGDSITFKKNTTFIGQTTINLTPGGKDVVTFEKNPPKGSVVIKNFDNPDILKVGNDTFTHSQIKKGAEIPGIKINLA